MTLLEAAKRAMRCLTCEEEVNWRVTQSFEEDPYHFLLKAIEGEERFEKQLMELWGVKKEEWMKCEENR